MLERDPCENGLQSFASAIRNGTHSIVDATQYYLYQIEHLNPKLQAFEHVAAESALKAAEALDSLLQLGLAKS